MIPKSTDVLIVGGGNAALCAAAAAREAGARVVVLEHAKKDMRGGNTRHTRNLRVMHTEPVHTLTESYSEEEFWQDILRVTDGNTNEHLCRLMIRESAGLLDWLHERGVRFQPALSGTLSLERTNAFFLGGGKTLLNAEYRYAESIGVDVHYECEVLKLVVGQSALCEAIFEHRGHPQTIRAKAVVVASGGFQANEEWMRDAWGEAADNFIIRGTRLNRGTILRNLMQQGAETVGSDRQCHAVAIDARAPKYDGGIVSRLDCVCFSIVVNQDAQRFYDEGEDVWPKRYAIWGRLVAKQPGQIAYAILDAKVRDNFMPSVFPTIAADSIEALAQKIDIPADALASTIETYNSAVVAGQYDISKPDDCRTDGIEPPKSHWALEIDMPPFFAYPLRPGITFTYLGLKVDDGARVEFGNDRTVRNVFAAGEVMAGNILGQGYCAGTGMTIGSIFGRIAGQNAALEALG